MNEWRKFSRLPESPEYWAGLRRRIDRAAAEQRSKPTVRGGWPDLALGAGIVAAAAVAVLIITRPQTTSQDASLVRSLAPADPVALELLNSPTPPHISSLLSAYVPESNR
jgi:hypothetical protein